MPDKTILILGGTTEARALADRLTGKPALRVISSLAGRLKPTRPLPGEVRVGGFGGVEGLIRYLKAEGVHAVCDLTHPFAAQISAHARAACEALNLPRVQFARPPWRVPDGLRWQRFDSLDAIAAALPALGNRALISVGVQGLPAFRRVAGVTLVVRLVEPPEAPLDLAADHIVVTGHPPFSLENERRLFAEHKIDTLVTKESGGTATEAKLHAAEEVGAQVLALARPAAEPGPTAETTDQVLDWLGKL